MLIGYARVSTAEQNFDLQKDALLKVGCDKIFTDIASGAKTERKGLEEALTHLRADDCLVVWRLDRLGRSLIHLIETIKNLNEQGIGFKSVTESIDTTTSGGKLIFHIFASLAEFERNLIQERTQAGLTAARARGRTGGRPIKFNAQKIQIAKDLLNNKNYSISEICHNLKMSRASFYRLTKKNN